MPSVLAFADDPLFSQHRAPAGHPERPERLDAARAALAHADLPFTRLEVETRDASPEELGRVHHESYLAQLDQAAGRSGYFDTDTFYGPESVAAARRAAGAALGMTECLLDGRANFGVALVRPPGHHARPDSAMGFCLLNNVAVAAAHARALGVERVAIVDFDVHHGNGTQEIFYADPSVLYVSLHQSPFYPGTGAATEVGSGDGRGYTLNVPLSAGAGDTVYDQVIQRIVAPALETYRPNLLLLSAGFDAHRRDPIGQMALTEGGYARMTHLLLKSVPSAVGIGLVLEGGYDLLGLSRSLSASLQALHESPAAHPEQGAPSEVSIRHAAEIERAVAVAREFWPLP